MLAPRIMFGCAPLPVVGMDDQTECRLIVVVAVGVPALAFLIAHDGCRRTRCRQGCNSGAHGQGRNFCEFLHVFVSCEMPRAKNEPTRSEVPHLAMLLFADFMVRMAGMCIDFARRALKVRTDWCRPIAGKL